jgi:hypothetical protein
MTCLRSFWNFREPGGFLGFGFFSSSTLPRRSGFTITQSPAHTSSLASDGAKHRSEQLFVGCLPLVVSERLFVKVSEQILT